MNATEFSALLVLATATSFTPGPNTTLSTALAANFGLRHSLRFVCAVPVGWGVLLALCAGGLGTLIVAQPALRWAILIGGCAYLLWMAWQAVKPGGAAPFEARNLPHDSPRTLFLMGFMTNLLNPKVAMFYLSFFPQFLHPERGQLLQQSLTLGAVQISTSAAVNALLVLGAARVALFLNRNAAWMRAQRYFMGTVLGLLALKLLTEKKAAA